jgi:hypothetical protein
MNGTQNKRSVRSKFCAISIGSKPSRVEQFAAQGLSQHLESTCGTVAHVLRTNQRIPKRLLAVPRVLIGTVKSHPELRRLTESGELSPPSRSEGFAIKTLADPLNPSRKALAVCGADPRGALWAVRDLCHYHWIGKKKSLPSVDVSFAPKHVRRIVLSWDYYIADPFVFIDRISEWKLNGLYICGHPFLLEQPEIFDYAASRGVDIGLAMGIFSWEFTRINIHRMPSWLPEAPPAYVKRSPDGRVICPSDKRSSRWQVNRIVEIVRAMPKLKGFMLQTGIIDFPDCSCATCSKLSADEMFLLMARPVIEAVKKERPDMYISHSIGPAQIYDRHFPRSLKHIDPCSQLMIDGGAMMSRRDVDRAMEHHFDGGKIVPAVKVYGQAHNGYLMPEWQACRRRAFDESFEILEYAARNYGSDTAMGFVQCRAYGEKNLLEPAHFAEATWHAGATSNSAFRRTITPRLREICDRDARHSDPRSTHLARGKSITFNKRMMGTYDDGGWIWGQIRICTPLTAGHCDLLVESDPVEWNFDLRAAGRKRPKSATLILYGAVVPAIIHDGEQWGDPLPYEFDIEINGRRMKSVKSSWRRGVRRYRKGTLLDSGEALVEAKLPHVFEGKRQWKTRVPATWLKPRTKIRLSLLSDGQAMIEKASLKLDY